MTDFDDDLLRRYLNGECTPEDAAALEAALAEDEALQRRLMALDPFAAPVRGAFEAIPGDGRAEALVSAPDGALPKPPPAMLNTRPPLREQKWAVVMAACLAGMMIGYGFSGFAPKAKDWRTEVAHYQALDTQATINAVTPDDDILRTQLAAVSDAVGAPLRLDELKGAGGMKLIRAQVLGFNGIPLAQIVFEGPNGAPIALCVLKGGGAAEMEASTRQGLASASWAAGGNGYLLIGGTDQPGLADVAETIRAQLGGA